MKIILAISLMMIFALPFAFAESVNVGTVYWKEQIISSNSFTDIYVVDDDMNVKEYPNFADKFSIHIWSESSPDGLDIEVLETGIYSGIFKGRVFIADSGETGKTRLVAMPGEKIYAKYVDYTLPNGGTQDIVGAAVVKVPGKDMNEILNTIDSKLLYKPNTDKVPSWVKNNAGWWAEGSIDDSSFVQGIQFLIKEKIIEIPPTTQGVSTASQKIPDWIKNNAGWWAEGSIDENSFVQGIQFLIKEGIMSVSASESSESKSNSEFAQCETITSAYKRLNCEKEVKLQIESEEIKSVGSSHVVGPVTFYYAGIGNSGNEFEISQAGQAMLRLRILVENNGNDNVTLKCSGPAVCSYDIWDGQKAFKYAGMDFVSGQIVIKPGTSYIFNMMFGPNIGYGGTTFEYDPSKQYSFRISEPWGNGLIPLNLN